MVYELRGDPCIAIEDVRPDRKNIMTSRSFDKATGDLGNLTEAIATFTRRPPPS